MIVNDKVLPSDVLIERVPKVVGVAFGTIWKVSATGWYHIKWTMKSGETAMPVGLQGGLYIPEEVKGF
jgi:hypothetical protein